LFPIKIFRFLYYRTFRLEISYSRPVLNLSRIYYIIKSLKDTVSLQTTKAIYFAHFQARLQYGILFWGHNSDCTKLFRLQKKVTRLISGMKRFESCRNVFKTFRILNVTSLYILEVLCFIKKYMVN
jgi:hypothetical protein